MTGHDPFDEYIAKYSTWGRWGRDDQIGTANRITREHVRAAGAAGLRTIEPGLSATDPERGQALSISICGSAVEVPNHPRVSLLDFLRDHLHVYGAELAAAEPRACSVSLGHDPTLPPEIDEALALRPAYDRRRAGSGRTNVGRTVDCDGIRDLITGRLLRDVQARLREQSPDDRERWFYVVPSASVA